MAKKVGHDLTAARLNQKNRVVVRYNGGSATIHMLSNEHVLRIARGQPPFDGEISGGGITSRSSAFNTATPVGFVARDTTDLTFASPSTV